MKLFIKHEANPSPLLDNPINRSIPVELKINLTGQLERPEPDFNFEFPNVSSTIKSELNYRLDSKEDRENQALYLLATGAFNRELKILILQELLQNVLNGIINGFFTDAIIKLKLV